jgi:hypothetical protein
MTTPIRPPPEPTMLSWIQAALPGTLARPAGRLYHSAMMRGSSLAADRRRARGLRTPVTFNDKVRRKMAFDRNPVLRTFQDRVDVRDYVAATIGPEHLTRMYDVAHDPGSIAWDRLPAEYVAKVNHACKGMILVARSADPARELPVSPPADWLRYRIHPDRADHGRMIGMLRRWLAMEYSEGEWAYRGLDRRVLVEELLRDPQGLPPRDYKFYVFNGRCRAVLVDQWTDAESFQITALDLFTPDWQHLPVRVLVPNAQVPPAPPPRLAEMIALAEELARPVDMLRVDLYAVGDRIVVGELTNYPGGGHHYFEPPSFDVVWGVYWKQSY